MPAKTLKEYLQEGEAHFKREQFAEAIENFKQALLIDAKNYDACFGVAKSYNDWGNVVFNQNDFVTARNYFLEAVKYYKEFPEAHSNLGLAFIKLEDYDNALKSFEEAIEQGPDYIDSYINLKQVVINRKEYAFKAKPLFLKGTVANPGSSDTWFCLAYCCYQLEDYAEAIENYKKVLSITPDDHVAAANLGLAYLALKDYENAFVTFKKTIEQKPDYINVYNSLLDLVRKQKKYAIKAKPLFLSGTVANPLSSDTWFCLADCCFQLEEYTEAIENYKKTLSITPDDDIALGNLGLSYEKNGQMEDAIIYYKKSLEQDSQKWAYDNLFNVLFNNKRLPEFITYAKELCKKNIDFREDNYLDILFYNDLTGNNSDSIDFFKQLTDKNKNDELLHRVLGYAYSNDRNFSDAVTQHRKAVDLNPSAANYYELGNAFLDKLSYKEAISNYEEALRINPDSIYAAHNKNYILEKQGRYRQAYEGWNTIVKDYHRILEAEKKDDSIILAEAYCYLGDIYLFSMDKNNLENALIAYEKSIKSDSNYISAYIGLARYYAEKKIQIMDQAKTSVSGTDSDELHSAYNMAHMNLHDYFTKSVQKLQERLKRYKNKYELNSSGELYLLAEQYDKAKEYFQDCTKSYPAFPKAFVGLGVVNMRTENYKDAIANFKMAIQFDPDDFNVQANLAEAYLKSGNFAEAEKGYRKILNFCPNYIDALMGLSEYNKIMGDKAMEENNISDAEDWYQQARGKYDRLVDLYISNEPASRRMNRADINNIYYSRGYVKVKLFEIGSSILKRGISLKKSVKVFSLQSPREDFKQILPGEDNYFKARNAIRKINNEIGITKNITKKWAPSVVILASLLVLVFTQYAFFFGRRDTKPESYSLDVSKLVTTAVADSSLIKTVPLIATFAKSEFTSKALAAKLIDSLLSKKIKDVESFILINKGKDEQVHISETSYGLFTFSSLIFLIIGFFLAEITKLKVGSIELEKSVLDTASTGPSLGIKGK